MKIPTTLKHKPVIVSEDYDKIDGRAAGTSDAKGLSLGLAQWNDRGRVDISAKVWRYTGEKWSRQSEEMPLHRVLDLAIFLCRSKMYFKDRYKNESTDEKTIDRVGLQGGAMNVAVCADNEHITGDLDLFEQCLGRDDELLSERMRVLGGLLKELEMV